MRSFAGWMFILWRQPFGLGDRIQIGEARGDVIDIRLFRFSLMEIGNWVHADQSTGRVVHIPNGRVFTETLANYSKGFQYIWEEIPVLVTFESDWEKAKQILSDIARSHTEHLSGPAQENVRKASRQFMIFYEKLTPIVYTSVRGLRRAVDPPVPVRAAPPPGNGRGGVGGDPPRLRRLPRHRFRLPHDPVLRQSKRGQTRRGHLIASP